MKTLTWIFSCFFVISCAENSSSTQNTTQERIKNKLKATSAGSDSTHQPSAEVGSAHILISSETSSPGIFRATLAIDQKNNKENLSIKDLITAITTYAISAGFAKVDCLSDQLACFAKSDMSLYFEPSNTPETVRIELLTYESSTDRIADASIKLFIEGLLLHLRQP